MKSIDIPDIQSKTPSSSFRITRVGVTDVKKLVYIKRANMKEALPLVLTIDLFVDLPASQKGSHMSRNLEIISDIVDSNGKKPFPDLETFCAEIARLLLEKHRYASYSEVKAEADYFLERTYPSGRKGLEHYKLVAEARANNKKEIRKLIGVKVIGMTACPCAGEVIKVIGNYKNIPPTHNQRNITTLLIEVPEEDKSVDANDLIDIVEKSFSSPTYEILKRKEEGQVVFNAHKNPKFVEDVVRDVIDTVLKKYKNLPDDVLVIVRSESEESIHKHNAFAERVTTLGELRK